MEVLLGIAAGVLRATWPFVSGCLIESRSLFKRPRPEYHNLLSASKGYMGTQAVPFKGNGSEWEDPGRNRQGHSGHHIYIYIYIERERERETERERERDREREEGGGAEEREGV